MASAEKTMTDGTLEMHETWVGGRERNPKGAGRIPYAESKKVPVIGIKRGIVGSWQKVSAKHLPAYLEEMTFRFNRRCRANLFIDTLRHMVTADR